MGPSYGARTCSVPSFLERSNITTCEHVVLKNGGPFALKSSIQEKDLRRAEKSDCVPNSSVCPIALPDMALEKSEESELNLFVAQCLQLINPKALRWPALGTLRKADAQRRLYERLFDADNVPYQLPARYHARVLKHLLGLIESTQLSPNDDVCQQFISETARASSIAFIIEVQNGS